MDSSCLGREGSWPGAALTPRPRVRKGGWGGEEPCPGIAVCCPRGRSQGHSPGQPRVLGTGCGLCSRRDVMPNSNKGELETSVCSGAAGAMAAVTRRGPACGPPSPCTWDVWDVPGGRCANRTEPANNGRNLIYLKQYFSPLKLKTAKNKSSAL